MFIENIKIILKIMLVKSITWIMLAEIYILRKQKKLISRVICRFTTNKR